MLSKAAREEVVEAINHERIRTGSFRPKEAAITYKALVPTLVDAGIPPEAILHYGETRGSNALAAAEGLDVVGRPMPPTAELNRLAQVLHHEAEYVSDRKIVAPAPRGLDC